MLVRSHPVVEVILACASVEVATLRIGSAGVSESHHGQQTQAKDERDGEFLHGLVTPWAVSLHELVSP